MRRLTEEMVAAFQQRVAASYSSCSGALPTSSWKVAQVFNLCGHRLEAGATGTIGYRPEASATGETPALPA